MRSSDSSSTDKPEGESPESKGEAKGKLLEAKDLAVIELKGSFASLQAFLKDTSMGASETTITEQAIDEHEKTLRDYFLTDSPKVVSDDRNDPMTLLTRDLDRQLYVFETSTGETKTTAIAILIAILHPTPEELSILKKNLPRTESFEKEIKNAEKIASEFTKNDLHALLHVKNYTGKNHFLQGGIIEQMCLQNLGAAFYQPYYELGLDTSLPKDPSPQRVKKRQDKDGIEISSEEKSPLSSMGMTNITEQATFIEKKQHFSLKKSGDKGKGDYTLTSDEKQSTLQIRTPEYDTILQIIKNKFHDAIKEDNVDPERSLIEKSIPYIPLLTNLEFRKFFINWHLTLTEEESKLLDNNLSHCCHPEILAVYHREKTKVFDENHAFYDLSLKKIHGKNKALSERINSLKESKKDEKREKTPSKEIASLQDEKNTLNTIAYQIVAASKAITIKDSIKFHASFTALLACIEKLIEDPKNQDTYLELIKKEENWLSDESIPKEITDLIETARKVFETPFYNDSAKNKTKLTEAKNEIGKKIPTHRAGIERLQSSSSAFGSFRSKSNLDDSNGLTSFHRSTLSETIKIELRLFRALKNKFDGILEYSEKNKNFTALEYLKRANALNKLLSIVTLLQVGEQDPLKEDLARLLFWLNEKFLDTTKPYDSKPPISERIEKICTLCEELSKVERLSPQYTSIIKNTLKFKFKGRDTLTKLKAIEEVLPLAINQRQFSKPDSTEHKEDGYNELSGMIRKIVDRGLPYHSLDMSNISNEIFKARKTITLYDAITALDSKLPQSDEYCIAFKDVAREIETLETELKKVDIPEETRSNLHSKIQSLKLTNQYAIDNRIVRLQEAKLSNRGQAEALLDELEKTQNLICTKDQKDSLNKLKERINDDFPKPPSFLQRYFPSTAGGALFGAIAGAIIGFFFLGVGAIPGAAVGAAAGAAIGAIGKRIDSSIDERNAMIRDVESTPSVEPMSIKEGKGQNRQHAQSRMTDNHLLYRSRMSERSPLHITIMPPDSKTEGSDSSPTPSLFSPSSASLSASSSTLFPSVVSDPSFMNDQSRRGQSAAGGATNKDKPAPPPFSRPKTPT